MKKNLSLCLAILTLALIIIDLMGLVQLPKYSDKIVMIIAIILSLDLYFAKKNNNPEK